MCRRTTIAGILNSSILEAAQAGLSWSIVLNKRDGYRRAFSQFDPEKVARYSEARIDKLTADPGIIRNRMKIAAAVKNARAFLAVQEEFGSFDAYCWRFVDGRPRQNRWKSMRQIPATTAESDAFSRDLKRRGFSFVGSTVIYAHMQAVGMVNDHLDRLFPISRRSPARHQRRLKPTRRGKCDCAIEIASHPSSFTPESLACITRLVRSAIETPLAQGLLLEPSGADFVHGSPGERRGDCRARRGGARLRHEAASVHGPRARRPRTSRRASIRSLLVKSPASPTRTTSGTSSVLL